MGFSFVSIYLATVLIQSYLLQKILSYLYENVIWELMHFGRNFIISSSLVNEFIHLSSSFSLSSTNSSISKFSWVTFHLLSFSIINCSCHKNELARTMLLKINSFSIYKLNRYSTGAHILNLWLVVFPTQLRVHVKIMQDIKERTQEDNILETVDIFSTCRTFGKLVPNKSQKICNWNLDTDS